jgi:hypothetical protein
MGLLSNAREGQVNTGSAGTGCMSAAHADPADYMNADHSE